MSSMKQVKYWELEKPLIQSNQHNDIRFYQKHGQVQVYPVVPSAPRGIGRGATIDLNGMTDNELDAFEANILKAIATVRRQRVEAALDKVTLV